MTVNDDFIEVRECDYKGEHYSVRDNGAIMRHPKKQIRPNDNQWTFGKKNPMNGYMMFGNVRVHIVVANAFHGLHSFPEYVVDHIDTNRCNNRPENLRWLTRLENILNNPATLKRIIYHCGSIEAFLADPSILRDKVGQNPDFDWMRSVSPEEARNALNNILEWAKNEDERLIKLLLMGISSDKIAKFLHTTTSTIDCRVAYLKKKHLW